MVDELCISNEDLDVFSVTVSKQSLEMLKRYVVLELIN